MHSHIANIRKDYLHKVTTPSTVLPLPNDFTLTVGQRFR
ncbi:hypothetical protein N6W67_04405 [Proteus mirabilis]|nr:hypothetical protein [Proteus mirabilis]UXJ02316.1 hypothetical protein N6W67_04405 [Proteus mirabilis]